MAREKEQNLLSFFKTALCRRFEPLMYFTFWIIPSVGVFTFIKLVFETQVAKLWQRGVMGPGKKCLGPFLNRGCSFLTLL